MVMILGRPTRLTSEMTGTSKAAVLGVTGSAVVLKVITGSAVVLGVMMSSAVVFGTTSTTASARGEA